MVLFDFDGVIADSFGAAFKTNKELQENFTEDEYRGMFSGNINEAFRRREKENKTQSREGEYFELYYPRLIASPIFPGIAEIIKLFSEHYALAIISSTISSQISEYLTRYGIAGYFPDILGNDVHPSKKEKIKMILDKHGTTPGNAVFITDTLGDAHEAEAAGVKAIGVTWGYQKKESLTPEKFLFIAETPGELAKAVISYLSR